MKKVSSTILVVVGLCLFIVPSAAATETSLWLINEIKVTSPLSIELAGKLKLTDLKASILGASEVECTGTFDGAITTGGKGELTELLNTAKEKISNIPLSGLALECASVKGCEGTGKMWPVGMPWKTQLETAGETEIALDYASASPHLGFYVECTVLGIKAADECIQTLVSPTIEKGTAPDLLVVYSEESTAVCTLGGEGAGDILGEGTLAATAGGNVGFIICIPWLIKANYESPEACELKQNEGSYTPGILGIEI
ncbi:MAG TPA: hypothetical protein VFR48_07365 [Solirubrobacteraceae bacterium]|nr:hypothetical protein [Solirubrobacteraceae bacterium]